jgi:hypothetical protein
MNCYISKKMSAKSEVTVKIGKRLSLKPTVDK